MSAIDSSEVHKTAILNCIRSAVSKTDLDVFDALDELFQAHFNKSANNMLDLRKRNAKNKGECFEVFCLLYLQSRGYIPYLLKDVPDDLLTKLGLTRHDVGIDIVAEVHQMSKKGEPQVLYFAVQCKYRSPSRDYAGRKTHRVGWKDISTFLSLCTRTGPWTKHIIMTNAESVSWKGKKTSKDYTIARKTFNKQPNTYWCTWLTSSQTLISNTKTEKQDEKKEEEKKESKQLTPAEIRELRMKYYTK